jgi:NitT/TauT family transport system permease protein
MKPAVERWLIIGAQVGIIVTSLALWELLVRSGVIKEFFFGQPTKIAAYVFEQTLSGYLLRHTWVTLYEEVLGFAVGTVIGTAVGLALWWSPYLSRVLEPFAVMFNATPKIVIAPILIVWFGIGLTSKVMIAVLICAIVAWLGAFEGVRNADADQMDMVRAVGGKERDVFLKIVVPASLPWLISTARINIGLALIGVITGEFLSSTEGLGYVVEHTARLYQMSETLGALALIAVVAAVQLYLLNWIEGRLFTWAYESEHRGEYIT